MKRFTLLMLAGLCTSMLWLAGCSQCSTCGKSHAGSCCDKPTTTGTTMHSEDTTHSGSSTNK